LWLIFIAGDRKGIGSKLMSRAVQSQLEAHLRAEIRATSAEQLADERDLLRLLDFIAESKAPDDLDFVRSTLEDVRALMQILRGASSETSSNTIGEVTVQRESVLAWDWLTSILPEGQLIARIGALHEPDPDAMDRDAAIVHLAKRYAAGWRPRAFGNLAMDDEDEDEEEPQEADPATEPNAPAADVATEPLILPAGPAPDTSPTTGRITRRKTPRRQGTSGD
jgi:hypothetical protein